MSRALFDPYRYSKPFSSPRSNIIEIKRQVDDLESVLDVGCGKLSPLRFTTPKCLVGFDAYQPDLDEAKSSRTHDKFILGNAKELDKHFDHNQFDACISLDMIEHLSKDDGLSFLRGLESVAKRRVIIVTPNGYLPQMATKEGDYQEHLSGWTPSEMMGMGYQVIGLNGLKELRTDYHKLRFKPMWFWAIVSCLTQKLWCRSHPDSAAAILCWKDL